MLNRHLLSLKGAWCSIGISPFLFGHWRSDLLRESTPPIHMYNQQSESKRIQVKSHDGTTGTVSKHKLQLNRMLYSLQVVWWHLLGLESIQVCLVEVVCKQSILSLVIPRNRSYYLLPKKYPIQGIWKVRKRLYDSALNQPLGKAKKAKLRIVYHSVSRKLRFTIYHLPFSNSFFNLSI